MTEVRINKLTTVAPKKKAQKMALSDFFAEGREYFLYCDVFVCLSVQRSWRRE